MTAPVPNPTPGSAEHSASMLAAHQAAERRDLVDEMVALWKRDHAGAQPLDVSAYRRQVEQELARLPAMPSPGGGA